MLKEGVYDGWVVDVFSEPGSIAANDGTAYFMVGSFCTELYASATESGARRIVEGGFADGEVLYTDYGLVVADDNAVYLVDLP